ncbi:hypothetical protein OJAV_G00235090 [Oryzias javanicus]|uniref:Ensconsin-like n=1 Tax=Oryzias javanicus TaxID=123683 RepID=A0A3S2LK21_ORYJA|nr:hypothetical protein OJAV_G00235090 [Oryzias javanicus]
MTDQQKRTGSSVYMSVQSPSSAAARPAAGFGLKVDERLKAAKERREEQQRLLASREQSRVEREQRARRFYQQQLQERREKLLEQRQKEEQRRAAVEEKRRLRLQEEQERFESALRKTLEKSRKARYPSCPDRSKKDGSSSAPIPIHKHQDLRPPIPLSSSHNQHRVTRAGRTKAAQRPDQEKSSNASNHGRTHSSTPPVRPPQVRSSRPVPRQVRLLPVPKEERARPVVRPANQLLQLKTEAAPVSPSPDPPIPQRGVRAVRAETKQMSTKYPHTTPPQVPHTTPPQVPHATPPQVSHTTPPQVPHATPPQVPHATPLQVSHTTPPQVPHTTPPQVPRATPPPGSSRHAPPGSSRHAPPPTSDCEEVLHLPPAKRETRLQPEEDDRRRLEEVQRRRTAGRAQQEALLLLEEKRRKEEQRRVQALKEAALLQKQRQEEQKEKMQQEDAERKARKKRLEEIMRRTRGADPADTENTEPPLKGPFEDAVKLPGGARTPQTGSDRGEDVLPAVTLRDCRSLRALSGLEEIQTLQ